MFKLKLFLIPLATRGVRHLGPPGSGTQTFLEVFVFGLRVAQIHLDR